MTVFPNWGPMAQVCGVNGWWVAKSAGAEPWGVGSASWRFSGRDQPHPACHTGVTIFCTRVSEIGKLEESRKKSVSSGLYPCWPLCLGFPAQALARPLWISYLVLQLSVQTPSFFPHSKCLLSFYVFNFTYRKLPSYKAHFQISNFWIHSSPSTSKARA